MLASSEKLAVGPFEIHSDFITDPSASHSERGKESAFDRCLIRVLEADPSLRFGMTG
jgi:hypothetical protein